MMEETKILPITPKPPEKRSSWYLLTGLILGLMLGLLYAWLVNPVVYENTTPATLQKTYKDAYRSTIARVFAATGDLERARQRLDLLEDADPIFSLGKQAQQAQADGNMEEALSLALLASALQSELLPLITPTPTTSTPDVPPGVPTQTLPPLTPVP